MAAPGLPETTYLPNPNDLPLFQYTDETSQDNDIPAQVDNGPRKIIDYVFSRAKWEASEDPETVQWIADLNGTAISVQTILSQNLEDRHCVECLNDKDSCLGEQCRRTLWDHFEGVEDDYITIMMTPDMGYGVFSTDALPKTAILGEYLGELGPTFITRCFQLKPFDHDDPDNQYTFGITGVGLSSANVYGNWTRFVNHHCVRNNIVSQRIMYGNRLAMAFVVRVDIAPGEQLFVNYGRRYFEGGTTLCRCDWQPGVPHLPPSAQDYAAARLAEEQRRAGEGDSGMPAEGFEGPRWEVPLTTVSNSLRGVNRTRAWGNPDVIRLRVDLRIRSDA